jgi:ankyrin repeat protein
MTTPDESGQLPLHRALRDNVTLGSIKLLVRGNPSAVQTSDNSGALPLLIACQYHDSAKVVQYLIGLVKINFNAVDREGNSLLHYACHGAKYNTIALLLNEYDAVSVSKRNAQNKLPIDLL